MRHPGNELEMPKALSDGTSIPNHDAEEKTMGHNHGACADGFLSLLILGLCSVQTISCGYVASSVILNDK